MSHRKEYFSSLSHSAHKKRKGCLKYGNEINKSVSCEILENLSLKRSF